MVMNDMDAVLCAIDDALTGHHPPFPTNTDVQVPDKPVDKHVEKDRKISDPFPHVYHNQDRTGMTVHSELYI